MKDLLAALFPPEIPAIARWRLTMFAAAVLMCLHVAWACGWLGYLGLGRGFAYAGDVVQVRAEVSSVREELIEDQIWRTRVQQCQAIKDGDSSSAYAQRVSQLLAKYQALTGRQYQMLSCAEQ